MKYFNQPPSPQLSKPTGNVPFFISKYYLSKKYDLQYIIELFRWAELEYSDTLAWASSDPKLHNKIKALKPIDVLAWSNEFKDLIGHMTDDLWNSLPKVVRRALSNTFEIHNKNLEM